MQWFFLSFCHGLTPNAVALASLVVLAAILRPCAPRMPEPHHGIERPPTRTPPPDQFENWDADWRLVLSCRPQGRGRDVKLFQMAMILLVLWITAATTM